MRIYQNRRLPTGRRKLWMHCTRSPRAGIPYRHKRYGVAGIPAPQRIQGPYRGVSLGFGRRAQARSCQEIVVGARCP
jgi:hypothetical protein